jgi:CheY-like chemotaxis protein
MLSDIKLSFADAANAHKLFETVLRSSRARPRDIKVLTNDDILRQFINGQKRFSEIEVVSNLSHAIDGLLADIDNKMGEAGKKAEIITDRILQADTAKDGEAMALMFDAEAKSTSFEVIKDFMQDLKIAVIDDDFVILEMMKNTFQKAGAVVNVFSDGEEFLTVLDTWEFDLAFLDLNMPRVGGIDVLKIMQTRDIRYPVIVLSAVTQRDMIIKVLQMGARSYLVKPLKPEDIYKKSIEILRANF